MRGALYRSVRGIGESYMSTIMATCKAWGIHKMHFHSAAFYPLFSPLRMPSFSIHIIIGRGLHVSSCTYCWSYISRIFFLKLTHTACTAALYNLLFHDLCPGHSSRVECKCMCSLWENMEEGVEPWKLVVQVSGGSLIPLAAQWQAPRLWPFIVMVWRDAEIHASFLNAKKYPPPQKKKKSSCTFILFFSF